ncbi:hypothetical protein [Erwinia piriflorinigrans]|uniref:hypothetical protein n=1 Tax=Erwinia piriflorinigrans TaxID=665097 RepID=UPI00065FF69F|nr:hypothetical protein [Erwinia piriflorinigrans]
MSKMDVQVCFIDLPTIRHAIRTVFPTVAIGMVSRNTQGLYAKNLAPQSATHLIPIWLNTARRPEKISSDFVISHITTPVDKGILSALLLAGFISLFSSIILAYRATARLLSVMATCARLFTR